MRVSAIGRPGHIDVECLEDTGSSNCTLYEGDLPTLGIHPGNYGFWLNPISVQVVGGTVLLRRVMLSLQVLSQGAGSEPIGGVFLDECLAMQGLAGQERLSGSVVHEPARAAKRLERNRADSSPELSGCLYMLPFSFKTTKQKLNTRQLNINTVDLFPLAIYLLHR